MQASRLVVLQSMVWMIHKQERLPQLMLFSSRGTWATGAPHSEAELKTAPPNLSFHPPQISPILVNSTSEILSASEDLLVPPISMQCTRMLSSSSLDPVEPRGITHLACRTNPSPRFPIKKPSTPPQSRSAPGPPPGPAPPHIPAAAIPQTSQDPFVALGVLAYAVPSAWKLFFPPLA